MPTDWSARTAAIEYFEKLVKQLKRANDDDKEIYEAALHALRRSQDHTAIQTKLTETVRENERLSQLLATTLDGEEGIHVSTGGKSRDQKLFSANDVRAFTAIGFALRKKHEAERAAKLTVTSQPMQLFDVLQAECGTSIAERLVEAISKAGLRVETSSGIDEPMQLNPVSQVWFRAGLLACREYMASFVAIESPTIAASIRANWWPTLGPDLGPPRQLRWSELTEGEYGEGSFRVKTKEEVSPTLEALPVALTFLQTHCGWPVPHYSVKNGDEA